MTIYDDMRGYVHTHDRNGWFDVATETTPMYQMVNKADAELAERMRKCVHKEACDRMAGMANLLVWYDSGTERDACTAYAYRCDCCRVWREDE